MYNDTFYFYGSNRSTIRDLFEYGKKRIAAVGAENVYDYSLGNPSVPAPEEVNNAIKEIVDTMSPIDVHGYTSAQGDNDCRKAIADNLNRRYKTPYSADDIFMTCGAAAALISVIRALGTEGHNKFLAVAPFFPEYKAFVESNSCKFDYVTADTKAFQIGFDELAQKIDETTAAVIINTPNNPSGVVYSEETLKKLASVLEKRSAELGRPVYLISDEPYRELVYTESGVAPFPALYYKDTIICYSYSKSLSLPGERIGYVLVTPSAADAKAVYAAIAGAIRCCGYVCAPSLLQRVVTKCADVMPDLDAYIRNKDLLYGELTRIGYECAKPDGAFYLFIKAPGGDSAKFCEICKKFDLLVVPADPFGCPGYMRAAYCVDYDMIKRSIPAFEKAFAEATRTGE